MKFLAHLVCWILLIVIVQFHFGYGLDTSEFWIVMVLNFLIQITGKVEDNASIKHY